jgi:hypothetical protein
VYRVFLNNWDDVKQVAKLRVMADEGQIDIWLDARKPGQYLDIMISTKFESLFLKFLTEHKLSHKVTIRDVRRLIADQEKPLTSRKWKITRLNDTDEEVRAFFKRRMRDSTIENEFGIFCDYFVSKMLLL